MNFGIFTDFHVRQGRTHEEAFDEHLAEVDAAEALGLDAVWLGEYHFSPNRSVLASPLAVASAIAARTQKIRIGGAVFVVPLDNPLRIAEIVATIDHISKGRLDFGIGRSGLTQFYQGYNIDYAETRDRFVEGLEVIMKAWTQETFSHRGKYWNFEDVTLVPKPYQQPYTPTRIAANSSDTFSMLGRMGYPIFVAGIARGIDVLGERIMEYRKAWEEAGHSGPVDVYLRFATYIAETKERAHADPMDSALHSQQEVSQLMLKHAVSAEEYRAGEAMASGTYDDILRDRVVFGTPEYVVERIQEFRERLGISGVVVETNHGGQIPNECVLSSMRLLAEKVMPNFK